MARGFQRSETSEASVQLYSHGNDPILLTAPGQYPLDGRGRPQALAPSLISVSTTKTLGQPAGTWQMQVKDPANSLLEQVADDDWVDISFSRGPRSYATMRGLVDGINRMRTIQSGATSTTYFINGRDHGKIFERTKVYFNRYIAENIGGSALLRSFAAANPDVFGDVRKTVLAFLQQFMSDQEGSGGGVFWTLPNGVPGVPDGSKFIDVVQFPESGGWTNGRGYTNQPPRVAFQAPFLDPSGGNIWDLAQQWSDPTFCELYTELVKKDGTIPDPKKQEELSFAEAAMAVILRDRPFPYGDAPRSESPWFDLPMVTIDPQDIAGSFEASRSGEERYNAFFVKGKAFNEYAGNNIDLVAPIVNQTDVERHGFQRFDVTSDYVPDPSSGWPEFINFQRAQARDWHGLNPYYYSGTLNLARGFPEIRVGTRLRIRGASGDETDETYYVESVTHTWTKPEGVKTSLMLTRGWVGTDQSYLAALRQMRESFALIDGPAENPVLLAGDGSFRQDGSTVA